MLEIYDRKSVETAEFLSVTAKGDSEKIISVLRLRAKQKGSMAGKKCTLGKVYDGKVIIEKKRKD